VYLKAERIGHAVSSAQDEATLKLLVEKQIPLEINITSNVLLGKYVKSIEEHPVKKYLQSGALVTLNTDDPTLFQTSLLNEYWILHSKLGYGMKDIFKIITNGFKASFMSENKKRGYIKEVNQSWSRHVIMKQVIREGWKNSLIKAFETNE